MYIRMTSLGVTPISGDGLSRVYKVHVQLPAWAYGVFIVVLVIAIVYQSQSKEGLSGKQPAVFADQGNARYLTQRGSASGDYSLGGDKFLNSRYAGPDPAVYTAASQRMLTEGVAEGGSDEDPGHAAPGVTGSATESFRRDRGKERMSERTLEGIARGAL